MEPVLIISLQSTQLALKKKNYLSIFMCIYLFVCMCAGFIQHLQRPKEGIRSPVTPFQGMMSHLAGAGNQSQILFKSAQCF